MIFLTVLHIQMVNVILQHRVVEVWLKNTIGITKTGFWKLLLIQRSMTNISNPLKDHIKAEIKLNYQFPTICSLS